VRFLLTILTFSFLIGTASAQDPVAPKDARDDEPIIQDNSFLIEEAYNQNFGVVQHIQLFQRNWITHDWVYAFTQEWPFDPAPRNQLSYTIPVVHFGGVGGGLGDVALNYRYQVLGDNNASMQWHRGFRFCFPRDSRTRRGAAHRHPDERAVQLGAQQHADHALESRTTITPSQKNPFGETAETYGVERRPKFYLFREQPSQPDAGDGVGKQRTGDRQEYDFSRARRPSQPWRALGLQLQRAECRSFPGSLSDRRRPEQRRLGILLYFSIEHPYVS